VCQLILGELGCRGPLLRDGSGGRPLYAGLHSDRCNILAARSGPPGKRLTFAADAARPSANGQLRFSPALARRPHPRSGAPGPLLQHPFRATPASARPVLGPAPSTPGLPDRLRLVQIAGKRRVMLLATAWIEVEKKAGPRGPGPQTGPSPRSPFRRKFVAANLRSRSSPKAWLSIGDLPVRPVAAYLAIRPKALRSFPQISPIDGRLPCVPPGHFGVLDQCSIMEPPGPRFVPRAPRVRNLSKTYGVRDFPSAQEHHTSIFERGGNLRIAPVPKRGPAKDHT